ncbi:FAD-dependent oxidoreductase [Amycolatopsis taiwanensis]|uniref:FAD-binding domain-containing protein n=1 Tax=Amycolatopsis taiwanensis TaxID=342230 RepID=A0A9W6RCP8_9PSEU|nr:NAD(P)/FAD-dependent oxidoreductase [Amycolatopsis taiwanensis]GLY71515.1 hypothetical protein Atai01_81340 [Amycolatopsis taiwanensis]
MTEGATAPLPSVVVVGAGPSGLVAASLLSGAGLRVRLLERLRARREGTRAPTLWPRAMNVMDLIRCGRRVRDVAHRVDNLTFVDDGNRTRVPLKDLACWTLPQYQLEEILENRARELGVTISRDTEVGSLTGSTPGNISLCVRRNGVDELVDADVVIAADGAHSAVRKSLDIDFAGHEYGSRFGLVDFVDEAGEYARDTVETYTGEPGTLVVVPLPGKVIRLVAPLGDRDAESLQVIRERLERYGFKGEFGDLSWRSVFYVSVKIAERFSNGGVALIGDAAHVQSPAGGRGMNNAIEDAMSVALHVISATTRPDPDYAHALSDYASERRRFVEAELGLIQRRTDRWVSSSSADDEASTEEARPPGLPAERRAALRAAGIPATGHGGGAVVGTEVCWRDIGIEPDALGRPSVLVVGGLELPAITGSTVAPHVYEVAKLHLIGRPEPAPNGIYVVRPDGTVPAFWPERWCRDRPTLAADIGTACRQASGHSG